MIVQGLWVGNKISLIEYLSYSSFIKNGFQYHLYTYEDLNDIPEEIIIKDANEILDKSYIKKNNNGDLTGFSDLFRYNLLFKKGGMYVDSDIICLKPFVTQHNVISGEINKNTKKQVASTQYLNFEKEHPIIKKLLELSLTKDLSTINFGDIGPKLVRELVDDKMILNYKNFNINPWWEWSKVLYPQHTEYLLHLIDDSEVYGIHLWNEMFRRNSSDKNKIVKNSLIDILNKKYVKV